MNLIMGCIYNFKTDTLQMIDACEIAGFELILGSDRTWIIGIDQSTSCTGLCLRDFNNEFLILLDVKNSNPVDKVTYFRDLKCLLRRLTENKHISYLIYEKPAPKDMYSSRVLQELKGKLEDWITDMPWLADTVVEGLFPQTWKKYVVDKRKGKNRSKSKINIAEDLCDMFPGISAYLSRYAFGNSYDSFDACGIVTGYLAYAFTSEGYPKIHGTIEKRHVSLVGYAWIDKDEVLSFPTTVLKQAKYTFAPKMKLMALDRKMYENVRMASSTYKCTYTVVEDKFIEPFVWKYGIDPDDKSKAFVMFVLRKNAFSVAEINVFKALVPWNEEIRGE